MSRDDQGQPDANSALTSEETFRATLNILADFESEKVSSQLVNRAVLNILEDFETEKTGSKDLNRAVLNILDDLAEEQSLTKTLNLELEQRVHERTSELAQSEERFRLLIEGVTDYAIYMLDPAGSIVTWNAGAERLKG